MGDLQGFGSQLEGWKRVLARTEKRLCEVQEKYESFFAEIEKAREGELAQLGAHLLEKRGSLPEGLDAKLDAAWKEAEAALEKELAALRERQALLDLQAEEARRRSEEEEQKVHAKNVDLDLKEEALKVRAAELLSRIEGYQQQLRELGSGFGFFSNLFALRDLKRERDVLREEQEDVLGRIEGLRNSWQKADGKWAELEVQLREMWIERTTQAQAVQAKIDHIEQVRPQLLERSALEKVLFEREPVLPAVPTTGARPCERCQTPNHPEQHFCAICGKRLLEDRPDLLGSLLEVAELNLHHRRFSTGVKACQEIIGLVRGLISGLSNFKESVEGMIDTENRYPVGKLDIDVPGAAVQYAKHFGQLESAANVEKGLHPRDFAAQIEAVMEKTYTEEKIQSFFETMGEELSRQADSQW
ncbi:MAG: hypothetical protein P1V51_07775 [Deltaproteobacteria bacterium]|nr:hypothetical protein [Deltaproteobacteria bacterium]